MGPTPHGLSRCSSVGESHAGSSLTLLQHCKSPQSLPQPPHPSVFSQQPPTPATRTSPPHSPWLRGRRERSVPRTGIRSPGDAAVAAVLRLCSGPLKREWGGRRQPTGWEQLLNMQMDVQEVRSSPGVQPPSLTLGCLPGLQPLGLDGQGLVPSCWLPRWAEGQKSNSPYNLAWKPHPGPTMDSHI